MGVKTINTKALLRNDTASRWTTNNPVLAKGEIGIESDTNKFKFGDGTTAWTLLPYAVDTSGKVDKVTTATENNVPIFDANGGIKDSGLSMQDRATMRSWYESSTDYGTFVEQAQGSANIKSFGFANTANPEVMYMEMTVGENTVNKLIPTKTYVDEAVATEATDTIAGVVKLNSANGIVLNTDGQLTVEGRFGELEGSNGLFSPSDREPRAVGNYSLLMCDAKGVDMTANRALAIVSGLGATCQSAPAGSTVYKLNNTYNNRIIAKCCEGGYIALNESESTLTKIVPVISVTINGSAFTPDSAADGSTPIEIKVSETVNPDAATTSIRLFGKMQSYASAHIGNGVSSTGGGRSLLIGGGVTKTTGNDNCIVGMNMYSTGNGNAMFGRNHIARKNRGLLAGTGHDTTNARAEGASAVGEYSFMDSNTLFAVGNGTSHTARSNAFEVRTDGIVLKSPNGSRWKITVSDTGAVSATAL